MHSDAGRKHPQKKHRQADKRPDLQAERTPAAAKPLRSFAFSGHLENQLFSLE
jgi:hypothetical protein